MSSGEVSGVGSFFNYVLFTNPITTSTTNALFSLTGISSITPKSETRIIQMAPDPLWKLAGNSGYLVKAAGASGALAVILGAYGAHTILPDKEKDEATKRAFQTANTYHSMHSLALLGAPLCRYPALTGGLMSLGIFMFCGTIYYAAVTGDNRLRKLTPVGGTCFILGWLSMVL
ncbi:unnamed protein product [Nesidiocoris tenuis]|uniref:DUF423 domain-containing protein n=1 Tax=Nesidiocoris tenuis TaxID=355587 RepID=A0A6H5HHP8_9HEMI|nr:unnamed protein product [Nesidiocoris tenuis]